jgi:hypothetical protein
MTLSITYFNGYGANTSSTATAAMVNSASASRGQYGHR